MGDLKINEPPTGAEANQFVAAAVVVEPCLFFSYLFWSPQQQRSTCAAVELISKGHQKKDSSRARDNLGLNLLKVIDDFPPPPPPPPPKSKLYCFFCCCC